MISRGVVLMLVQELRAHLRDLTKMSCDSAGGGRGYVHPGQLSIVDWTPSASGGIANSPTQSTVLSPIKCV